MRGRTLTKTLLCVVVLTPVAVTSGPSMAGELVMAAACRGLSSYDNAVLSDAPVAYWRLGETGTTRLTDCSGFEHNGSYVNSPAMTTMPNGDRARTFNGANQYAQVPDDNHLSVPTTGILALEAWIRPSTLNFPNHRNGYIHWMGKGVDTQHEYAARMYRKDDPNGGRPNRISGYAFNLSNPPDELGVGSYFQDSVTIGEWIHVAVIINTKSISGTYPIGYTRIYRNGTARDTDSLRWAERNLDIRPGNGTAPFRIGTRDLTSWFQGAIGKVAVYDYEISASRIKAHCETMRGMSCP